MKTLKNFPVLSLTLAVSFALTACGGGSTPSSATPPVSPPVTLPPPTVTPANLQTTVPNPTYATGSALLQAFTELNSTRQTLGLGLLAQNIKLDTAAFNHANYIVTNFLTDDSVFSHNEKSALPGFTGVTPSDRSIFTGYGAASGEELSLIQNSINGEIPLSPIMLLFNTVYHRAGLLDQCFRDVGLGQASQFDKFGNPFTPFAVELGYQTGCQTNASNFLMHYPITGQTAVPLSMTAETPNPLPNLPLINGSPDFTKTTSPISITSAAGTTLTMTSLSVTAQGSTTPILLNTITAANDPNPQFARSNWLYFIGNTPFQPNTVYNVAFVGTVNGVNVTQNWSFTTK